MDLNHHSPVLRTGALILLPFHESNYSMSVDINQQLKCQRRTEASNLSPCSDSIHRVEYNPYHKY